MPAARKLPPGVYPSGATHYQFRVTLPADPVTGKRRQIVRGGFRTPEDAFIARVACQREQGNPAALRATLPGEETVAQAIERFVRNHDVDESTRHIYRWRATHVVAGLGNHRLDALTPAIVQEWIDQLARAVSPSTARDARSLLVLCLNRLVRLERLPRNVATLTRAPRHEPRRPRVLRGQEIARFLAAADADEHRALWYLGLFGQLRPGELAGLRWPDLDLARGVIHVRNTRARDAQGRWTLGNGAKTPASARSFDLPRPCVEALREHRRRQLAERLAAPVGYLEEHDFVFPSRRGRILDHSVMQHRLRRVCAIAGIDPPLTPHGLRHSGAIWARRQGVPPEVVQRRLGHRHIAMTLETYSQPDPAEQAEAARAFERAYEALRDG